EEVEEIAVVPREELGRRLLHEAARHQQHQVLVGHVGEPVGRARGAGLHAGRWRGREIMIIADSAPGITAPAARAAGAVDCRPRWGRLQAPAPGTAVAGTAVAGTAVAGAAVVGAA